MPNLSGSCAKDAYMRHPKSNRKKAAALTINGPRKRNKGILGNSLYVDDVRWDLNYYVRDPDSGVQMTKSNDPRHFVPGKLQARLMPTQSHQ